MPTRNVTADCPAVHMHRVVAKSWQTAVCRSAGLRSQEIATSGKVFRRTSQASIRCEPGAVGVSTARTSGTQPQLQMYTAPPLMGCFETTLVNLSRRVCLGRRCVMGTCTLRKSRCASLPQAFMTSTKLSFPGPLWQ